MLNTRATAGRFESSVGFHKLRITEPGRRYELLVFDRHWRLVGPLNEWYRLRGGRGSPRTRDTYLAMLCPFFGFLVEHGYAWDAEPETVREYTRQYLLAAGCVVRRAWKTDGHTVALTNQATLSPSALGLFLAATRDFYTLLIEGEWDAERQRYVPLYGYTNPMYSDILLRWKREYLRADRGHGPERAPAI